MNNLAVYSITSDSSLGQTLPGVTVTVYEGVPATDTLATLYEDPAGDTSLANPTTTDGLGNLTFCAATGYYTVEYSGPGINGTISFPIGISAATGGGGGGAIFGPLVKSSSTTYTYAGTLFAAPTPGLYLLSIYLVITAASGTVTGADLTLGWTDPSGDQSNDYGSSGGDVGDLLLGPFNIYVSSGDVTYSVVFTIPSGSATFNLTAGLTPVV